MPSNEYVENKEKKLIHAIKSSSTTYMAIVAAVPAGGAVAEAVAEARPAAAGRGAAGPGVPVPPLAGLAKHCRGRMSQSMEGDRFHFESL